MEKYQTNIHVYITMKKKWKSKSSRLTLTIKYYKACEASRNIMAHNKGEDSKQPAETERLGHRLMLCVYITQPLYFVKADSGNKFDKIPINFLCSASVWIMGYPEAK